MKGARRVEAVVIPTEKATSPLHRKLMMLLDTPPGQQPTNMMPIANEISKLNNLVNVYAIKGIKVYCAQAPMKISIGLDANILKS